MTKDEMCNKIQVILKYHEFDKPVLVSHSYRTLISTQLLKSPKLANQIGPVVLIDPISILLHLLDVAYNFTHRKPQRANEHQLYYFGSMDMGVSHSLSRCFFWSENVLWKQDIGERAITVSLAERDLIVNTKAVRNYLATYDEETAARKEGSASDTTSGDIHMEVISENGVGSTTLHPRSNGNANTDISGPPSSKTVDKNVSNGRLRVGWQDRKWRGKGVDLIWFRTLDHAQLFDKAETRKPLVEAIYQYSFQSY
ncbi:hypothetical protein EPUS_08382 [Endocarpon pusillum Z07020]|uniref:Uncharacterized protein n=1 Tax=Endocarpon pusillum (strain Z07020 / HMAS-L-300199) TaxID=1263415 RepID=U1FW08_ENDPU|nr:uncharacterized protein EPUS_08382 [Endocarpon pusillum Z07020]ERF69032.1 hypothetical protein EPUS_08382 [Endocarpon pusillum Z07020]